MSSSWSPASLEPWVTCVCPSQVPQEFLVYIFTSFPTPILMPRFGLFRFPMWSHLVLPWGPWNSIHSYTLDLAFPLSSGLLTSEDVSSPVHLQDSSAQPHSWSPSPFCRSSPAWLAFLYYICSICPEGFFYSTQGCSKFLIKNGIFDPTPYSFFLAMALFLSPNVDLLVHIVITWPKDILPLRYRSGLSGTARR